MKKKKTIDQWKFVKVEKLVNNLIVRTLFLNLQTLFINCENPKNTTKPKKVEKNKSK
jgi:hypothetical protein